MKSKGKCYSGVDRGQRRESDLYETHYSLTRQFLDNEYFDDLPFYEPCYGNGAIVKVLKERFSNVTYNDISNDVDFLLEHPEKVDYIITNPPFSLAFEFIMICKRICDKFALFLPLNYLHGKRRYDYIFNNQNFTISDVSYTERSYLKKQKDGTKVRKYSKIPKYDLIECDDFRLETVYVFTRFPLMTANIREDGKYPTGMAVFAWFVWDRKYKGQPKIKWLDNNKHVLGKNDLIVSD